MDTADESSVHERAPIRQGLLSGPLAQLDRVRLAGTTCTSCGETVLGVSELCANCGRDTVREIALSERGTLWSYTVIRHRPPGAYKGPEPFVPFGVGLVELPDGLRVMSPIACVPDKLRIGLELQFKPYVRRDENGREIVAFDFEPANEGSTHD